MEKSVKLYVRLLRIVRFLEGNVLTRPIACLLVKFLSRKIVKLDIELEEFIYIKSQKIRKVLQFVTNEMQILTKDCEKKN